MIATLRQQNGGTSVCETISSQLILAYLTCEFFLNPVSGESLVQEKSGLRHYNALTLITVSAG